MCGFGYLCELEAFLGCTQPIVIRRAIDDLSIEDLDLFLELMSAVKAPMPVGSMQAAPGPTYVVVAVL